METTVSSNTGSVEGICVRLTCQQRTCRTQDSGLVVPGTTTCGVSSVVCTSTACSLPSVDFARHLLLPTPHTHSVAQWKYVVLAGIDRAANFSRCVSIFGTL